MKDDERRCCRCFDTNGERVPANGRESYNFCRSHMFCSRTALQYDYINCEICKKCYKKRHVSPSSFASRWPRGCKRTDATKRLIEPRCAVNASAAPPQDTDARYASTAIPCSRNARWARSACSALSAYPVRCAPPSSASVSVSLKPSSACKTDTCLVSTCRRVEMLRTAGELRHAPSA